MSAIYGVISLNGSPIDVGIADKIHNGYCDCQIDRHMVVSRENAVMGCELQFFTKEAGFEKLPFIDEEHHIMFTADCVLDNREEIINQLEIKDANVPDGWLLYQAYLIWGKECMKYLRGMFSFVAYHWDTGEVHLQTDHFSSRCLFYQVKDGVLYFSTLFFPLIQGTGLKYEQNERWLVDEISLRSPVMITEPEETAVLDVYKVVSGQYVLVSGDGVKKVTYWKPKEDNPTNKRMTEEECAQKVRALMKKSVSQMIRTDGEVAVLLSEGLDSSTVACIAAPLLKEQGKNLYSYTSVPLKEAGLPTKGYLVYDETEGVKKICEAYPNIIPTFMDCPGKNILTEAEQIVKEWELPCKSEQNAVWLKELKIAARQNGCKILLTGCTGNCTLSAGNVGNYFRYEISKGHFIKAYQGLGHYMRKYQGHKKQFIVQYIKAFLKHYMWYFDKNARDVYKDNITRKNVGERHQLTKRLNKEHSSYKPAADITSIRNDIYMLDANAQIGEIETASSLYRGILERDPMRNVEFIEFCMTVPMLCFNNEEYDRRLVREFMEGIVPASIRLNVQHRGRQSGDNEYRIAQVWDEYLPIIKSRLSKEEVLKYLDQNKIEAYYSRLIKDKFSEQFIDMRMIVDAYIFSIFLEKLHKQGQTEI